MPAWLAELFRAIDARDTERFVSFITEDGSFIFGNAPAVNGRQGIREAVAGFLRALTKGMRDTVVNPEEAIRIVKERDPLVDSAVELRRLQIVLDKSIGSPKTPITLLVPRKLPTISAAMLLVKPPIKAGTTIGQVSMISLPTPGCAGSG